MSHSAHNTIQEDSEKIAKQGKPYACISLTLCPDSFCVDRGTERVADIQHWSDTCIRQHLGWVSPSVTRGKHLRRLWDRREALVYSFAKWDAHAKNYASSAVSSSLRNMFFGICHLQNAKTFLSAEDVFRALSAAIAACVAPSRAFRGRQLLVRTVSKSCARSSHRTSSWSKLSSISNVVSI